jgi:predicted metal-dependent hydrolase
MTAPPLPSLRARNRLAETILAALHEPAARRVLATLAWNEGAVAEWLAPDDPHQCGAVSARARRASVAVAAAPLCSPAGALGDALEAAALLFDAGLFFEVHELLEPHWRGASGDTREVLQGLIQIAVGYQHQVNGNTRGARSLLGEGAMRVRGRHLLGVSLDDFAEEVVRTGGCSPGDPPTAPDLAVPRFPRGWQRQNS